MFAIVQLGNRQFKVKANDFIRVPFQNQAEGSQFQVPVLAFISDKNSYFDSESLKKSQVTAVLIRQMLSKKQLVFKKKRRKGYRKTQGHRQKMSELKILELKSPDGQVAKGEFKPRKPKDSASKTAQSGQVDEPKSTKSDKIKSGKSPSAQSQKPAQTSKKVTKSSEMRSAQSQKQVQGSKKALQSGAKASEQSEPRSKPAKSGKNQQKELKSDKKLSEKSLKSSKKADETSPESVKSSKKLDETSTESDKSLQKSPSSQKTVQSGNKAQASLSQKETAKSVKNTKSGITASDKKSSKAQKNPASDTSSSAQAKKTTQASQPAQNQKTAQASSQKVKTEKVTKSEISSKSTKKGD